MSMLFMRFRNGAVSLPSQGCGGGGLLTVGPDGSLRWCDRRVSTSIPGGAKTLREAFVSLLAHEGLDLVKIDDNVVWEASDVDRARAAGLERDGRRQVDDLGFIMPEQASGRS